MRSDDAPARDNVRYTRMFSDSAIILSVRAPVRALAQMFIAPLFLTETSLGEDDASRGGGGGGSGNLKMIFPINIRHPYGAAATSLCPLWLADLYAVTQPISDRQDHCAQLWMIDEVRIEFAQRLG